MTRQLKWSDFIIRLEESGGTILLKNTFTGAVIRLNAATEGVISNWLSRQHEDLPPEVEGLAHPDNALLVSADDDEQSLWRASLLDKRNNQAHTFTLYFLPTMECQSECGYCFEGGVDRMRGMTEDIRSKSLQWIADYLDAHPEITTFRLVFFGGEPLLRSDIVQWAVNELHSLSLVRGLTFWCEVITNGELLTEDVAHMLSQHEWRRVQITLDGPRDVHNRRRHGKKNRPTFDAIMQNVRMLLATSYIQTVDLRLTLDADNGESVPDLIEELAQIGAQDRVSLTLGLTTPTMLNPHREDGEQRIATLALQAWAKARACGFKIPDEFIVGPWCIAISKHSVVLLPDGAMQKCFCTAGRKEYNFGSVDSQPEGYAKDAKFEHFERSDLCIEEKCPYLPLCGGACIHDAMVAAGGPQGGANRHCSKLLVQLMNEGLLRLSYPE